MSAPQDTEKKLQVYERLLIKWSKSINLVSKSTIPYIRERHFQDSMQLIPFLKRDDSIIDIGSGAGFPGMVLAIYGFKVTLLDSDEKKCVFLENVSRETNTRVDIVCDRMENFVPLKPFDVVCSRGVAVLKKLIVGSKKLVREGSSRGLFLKGERIDLEIDPTIMDRIAKIESLKTLGSYIIQYQF